MTAAWSDADRSFMRQALALGERGRGSTKPNPVVGALVVKNGKVLARGYHRQAGLPHAEIEALAKLGMRAPGAVPGRAPSASSARVSSVWSSVAVTRTHWSAAAASPPSGAPA
jgi:tRNA(Arg) A34 adenosine deaminase TadA